MALSDIAKRLLEIAMFSRPEAQEICTAIDNVSVGNATNATITRLTVTNSATFANNANMVFNATTGTMIGTNANQKIALWGGTPVIQPVATAPLVGMNGNAATNANAVNMNSNGNFGTIFLTFSDVVQILKKANLTPAS